MEVVYLEPLYRLVKIAARSFYDDVTTEGDNQSKTGRSDKGIAVVVLDALARRQWVREEVLAKDLKLHPEQLRLILCFLGEEKLITREYREEIAEGAKLNNAAVAATVDVLPGSEADDEIKLHARSSCCLDYVQIYDVVRCRLHRMKKKLKKYELEDKNTRLDYVCPNCAKKLPLTFMFFLSHFSKL